MMLKILETKSGSIGLLLTLSNFGEVLKLREGGEFWDSVCLKWRLKVDFEDKIAFWMN